MIPPRSGEIIAGEMGGLQEKNAAKPKLTKCEPPSEQAACVVPFGENVDGASEAS